MRAEIRTLTGAPSSILTQPAPPSLSITTMEEALPPLRRPYPATIGAEARGNRGYRPILGLLPVTINRPPAQVNMQSMN